MRQNIKSQLKELKNIAPSAEWKRSNREALLSYINRTGEAERKSRKGIIWLHFFGQGFRHVIFQPATALLAIFFMVIASSLVVNAAYYSLPGDTLYSLKLRLERAQLAFVSNDEEKTELKVEFARKRVYELDRIIVDSSSMSVADRAKKVHVAINTLKKNVEQVRKDVDKTGSSDQINYKIALSLGTAATELKEALGKSNENLPDDVKKNFEIAIDSTEDTGITALVKGIGEKATTSESIQGEEESDSDTKEILAFLQSSLVSIENQMEQISLEGLSDEDTEAAMELQDQITLLIGDTKTALESENYDIAAKDIQLARQLLTDLKALTAVDLTVEESISENTESEDTVVTTPDIVTSNTDSVDKTENSEETGQNSS